MIHIALDTSGIGKTKSQKEASYLALKRLIKANQLTIHAPYVVKRELETQELEYYLKEYRLLKESLRKFLRVPKSEVVHKIINDIQKQIEENAKIHVIKKHIPVQILSSEGKVSGIELENVDTHEKQVIECSGIFPYVGQDPNTDCVQDLGVLNERGYVLVDANCQTKIPGIYAAGDVIDKELRQVVTACNDGAIAAQHAFHTIKGI